MLGNTLQSTGYQPVRPYICLQKTQCKVPKPRVGQVEGINHFKSFLLYTYTSLKMELVHNTSHVLTYAQLPIDVNFLLPTAPIPVSGPWMAGTYECCYISSGSIIGRNFLISWKLVIFSRTQLHGLHTIVIQTLCWSLFVGRVVFSKFYGSMLPLYIMYGTDVVGCFGVWVRETSIYSQLQLQSPY